MVYRMMLSLSWMAVFLCDTNLPSYILTSIGNRQLLLLLVRAIQYVNLINYLHFNLFIALSLLRFSVLNIIM